MKNSLLNFSVSLLVSFIIGILITLIVVTLKLTTNMDATLFSILQNALSFIPFFILGFLYSYKNKKRGILNGLLCIFFYVLTVIIFNLFKVETSPIYIIIIRCILMLLSSIIGVNVAFKIDQTN